MESRTVRISGRLAVGCAALSFPLAGGRGVANAADYIVDIDFEKGKNFSVEGGAGFSIVSDPAGGGSKVGRFRMTSGRTEMKTARIPKDTEIWAGWSVMVDPKFPYDRANISQFHGFQSCSKGHRSGKAGIYKINFQGDKFGLDTDRLPKDTEKTFAPFKKGQWNDVLVHAKFSSSGGFFTMYVDKKPYKLVTGHTFGSCPGGPSFKAGVYKGSGAGTNNAAVAYVDNVRIAKNAKWEDVAPWLKRGGKSGKSGKSGK